MVNKIRTISEIKGSAFQEARERLDISVKELARRACFSVRQIEQIENGKSDAFYSLAIKIIAAKKVANLLKLSEDDAFEFKPDPLAPDQTQEVSSTITATSETNPPTINAPPDAMQTGGASGPRFIAQLNTQSEQLEPRFSPDLVNRSPMESMDTRPRSRRFLIVSLLLAVIALLGVSIQSGVLTEVQAWFSPKPAPIVEVIASEEKPAEPENSSATIANISNSNNVANVSNAAAPTTVTTATTSALANNAAGAVPATAPVTISPSNTLEGCPSVGVSASSYTPTQSNRSADMVYVVSKTNQTVCVVDANGKIQNRSLDAGASTTFYGKPPFKVMTVGLSQVDMYFQGWKVRPANPNDKTIELLPLINATPIPSPSAAPASSANSPSANN